MPLRIPSSPLQRQTLRLGDLSGRHFPRNFIKVPNRLAAIRTGQRDREVVPNVGSYIVLRHAAAVLIHDAKVVLGDGDALLCGLAIPAGRLRFVLSNPYPLVVEIAEGKLAVAVALLTG